MKKSILEKQLISILDPFIDMALTEDIGEGDHTSSACISDAAIGKAQLLLKENGILAGVELSLNIFKKVDEELQMETLLNDGAKIKKGDIAFFVEGKVQSILKAERLVLNCMQKMSGIATFTNELVKILKGTPTKVTDTRKTTPCFRAIEKWAVRIGGGENHRFGLYDMLLIKDNHIDYAGGITKAIEAANTYLKQNNKDLKIEIEARTINDVKTIISVGKVDRIMLDNFSVENTKQAVRLINNKYETESSGNITKNNIRQYAECGVGYISVGALTHSVKSLDMSLKAII